MCIAENGRGLHLHGRPQLFQIYIKSARLHFSFTAEGATDGVNRATVTLAFEIIRKGLPLRFLSATVRLSSLLDLGFAVVDVRVAIDSVLDKRLYGMSRAFIVILLIFRVYLIVVLQIAINDLIINFHIISYAISVAGTTDGFLPDRSSCCFMKKF